MLSMAALLLPALPGGTSPDDVASRAASAIAADAAPLCFRVPAVRFRFAGEAHDPTG